ncbi:hypothetical protein [Anaerovorax sp. IOR16]|uniref:hypothetical protein n=1 Tax=Anaerovorax sp. IOR16 TaxID=2773458 RepID=UPI0019CFA7F2|nr:hypothetical protein [Anaerovorax sp. IOR16]
MDNQINKPEVDFKKLGICFLATAILFACLIYFRSIPKTENIFSWSSEDPYCFAVDAPYDGDTFKAGTYHFYSKNTVEGKPNKAWEIFVTKTYYKSIYELKKNENGVCIIGSTETPEEFTARISPGKYVYVIYRGAKDGGWYGTLSADILPE